MAKKLTLKFLTGPIKGQEFTFNQDPEIYIGRVDDCDITLKDPKISSEHCGIFFEDGAYFLEDFGSTNGTYINTTKIEEGSDYTISGGETLFLGASKISLTLSSSSSSARKPVEEEYTPKSSDEEFEFEEDTNIKKIKKKKGVKSFFDVDFYLDLKEKFMALDNTKKMIVISISLVAIMFLFFIFSRITNQDGGGFFRKSYSDDSEKITQLNDSKLNKVYGYYVSRRSGKEDFSHPKKIRFKFKQSEQEKSTIYYSVTSVDYLDEVVIKLNNVKIAQAPLTGNEVAQVKLSLPFENLNFEKENILEFINTRNLGAKKYKKWAILVNKIEKRLLPKPDFEKAQENYVKADKFYKQRKISRGNRYKALRYYQAAIDFMELMKKEKPDFYDDSMEKIKLINKDFDAMYQKNKYAIFNALKFNKHDEAKIYVNYILEEIPDEDDPRYQKALQLLNRLR